MFSIRIIPLLLCLSACGPSTPFPMTFQHHGFTVEQVEELDAGLAEWRKALGTSPGLRAGAKGSFIVQPEALGEGRLGLTNGSPEGARVRLDIHHPDMDQPFTFRAVWMHELGHVFALPHTEEGLMRPKAGYGPCIDQVTLKEYCKRWDCNGGERTTCEN